MIPAADLLDLLAPQPGCNLGPAYFLCTWLNCKNATIRSSSPSQHAASLPTDGAAGLRAHALARRFRYGTSNQDTALCTLDCFSGDGRGHVVRVIFGLGLQWEQSTQIGFDLCAVDTCLA